MPPQVALHSVSLKHAAYARGAANKKRQATSVFMRTSKRRPQCTALSLAAEAAPLGLAVALHYQPEIAARRLDGEAFVERQLVAPGGECRSLRERRPGAAGAWE